MSIMSHPHATRSKSGTSRSKALWPKENMKQIARIGPRSFSNTNRHWPTEAHHFGLGWSHTLHSGPSPTDWKKTFQFQRSVLQRRLLLLPSLKVRQRGNALVRSMCAYDPLPVIHEGFLRKESTKGQILRPL